MYARSLKGKEGQQGIEQRAAEQQRKLQPDALESEGVERPQTRHMMQGLGCADQQEADDDVRDKGLCEFVSGFEKAADEDQIEHAENHKRHGEEEGIRVHQRVELAISAFGTYYVNDVLDTHGTKALGFSDLTTDAGKYPMPYTTTYNGVLRTNEVESLHPWAAGLKFTVQVNANRTKAQREYDKEQKRLRKQQKEAEQEQPSSSTVVVVEDVPTEEVEEIPEEIVLDPREEVIRRILELADSAGIDLCETFCYIHDTIYIGDAEPTPVIREDPVAKQLDDMLAKAVIFFDLDKAIPILEPEDILIRIAEILRNHPDQKIHVNGHACKLGKPDYNKRLALRRAKAVAKELEELGVRDDQMIIASLGDDVPYRYNGHHQLSKDRRVEIVPTYRTTEIVRPGSRLAQIARRHYGNPDFWVFIYEANRDQITDPSNLPVGIEIEIPNLSERLKGMNETEAAQEAQRLKEEILNR